MKTFDAKNYVERLNGNRSLRSVASVKPRPQTPSVMAESHTPPPAGPTLPPSLSGVRTLAERLDYRTVAPRANQVPPRTTYRQFPKSYGPTSPSKPATAMSQHDEHIARLVSKYLAS